MNKRALTHLLVTGILLSMVLQACSPAVAVPPATVNDPIATQQQPGSGAEQPTTAQSGESPQPGSDDPTQTSAPPPAPAEIQHFNWPATPSYLSSQQGNDCAMGYTYNSGQATQLFRACDSWAINFLERPVTGESYNYLPYLDIETMQLGADSFWYYVRIRLFDPAFPSDASPISYMLELDTNLDGRGDYLLAVEGLPLDAGDWTVAGVRVWQDTNGDVGSATSNRSDPTHSGDGYDTLVFDQGVGADPDLVWARRSPDAVKAIEIAFKPALISGDATFYWRVWSFQGTLDPSRFDLVDASPGAYQLDNTCTMGFNGNPLGFPNACYTLQPTPTPEPVPACVKPPKPSPDTCWIWIPSKCQWECHN